MATGTKTRGHDPHYDVFEEQKGGGLKLIAQNVPARSGQDAIRRGVAA